MTLPAKFENLKPAPLGVPVANVEDDLRSFEQRHGIVLPSMHREILTTFAAPVIFEVRCAYRPVQNSPWDRKDGSQSLEAIYGPGAGDDSLDLVNSRLEMRLPARTIAIGASSAGNQICLSFAESRLGHIYFWDHENEVAISGSETDFSNMYLVNETFEGFIDSLYPRDEPPSEELGIVESKSWLDF